MSQLKRFLKRKPAIPVGIAVLSLLLVAALASGVFAVHDLGLFELDGNAVGDPLVLGEDWDIIYNTWIGNDPSSSASDALLFIADKMGTLDDSFTGGNTKDKIDLPEWKWTSNPSRTKNELVNAYAAVYPDRQPATRSSTSAPTASTPRATPTWASGSTRTRWMPSGSPAGSFTGQHRVGDVFVLSTFTKGGDISTIQVYEWVGDTMPTSTDGTLNLIETGADCTPALSGAERRSVRDGQQDSPPPHRGLTHRKMARKWFPTGAFFEGGLNLTQLIPGYPGCFSSFLAETRSSSELTAELKDFALGNFDLCSVNVTKTGDALSKVGDPVNYTITIENTGAKTLYQTSVVDSLASALDLNWDSADVGVLTNTCAEALDPEDSCTITYPYTVQPGDPDPLLNTVSIVYDAASVTSGLQGDFTLEADDSWEVNLFQPSVTSTRPVTPSARWATWSTTTYGPQHLAGRLAEPDLDSFGDTLVPGVIAAGCVHPGSATGGGL